MVLICTSKTENCAWCGTQIRHYLVLHLPFSHFNSSILLRLCLHSLIEKMLSQLLPHSSFWAMCWEQWMQPFIELPIELGSHPLQFLILLHALAQSKMLLCTMAHMPEKHCFNCLFIAYKLCNFGSLNHFCATKADMVTTIGQKTCDDLGNITLVVYLTNFAILVRSTDDCGTFSINGFLHKAAGVFLCCLSF